jgi:hypothetical protein
LAIINVYVDGFNLYYGALKRTPYKWLDLGKLAEILLPTDTVQEIHYFTARVSSRPYNPTSAHDYFRIPSCVNIIQQWNYIDIEGASEQNQ